MATLEQARLVGPWVLAERIGGGGQADVYRATHARSDEPAALKLFHRSVWGDDALRARFRRECEALAALDHPCIVPILGSGEDDGRGWLAMGLASGGSLADRLVAGPLPPGRALAVLARVARALDAAHAAGLVHRDVTPSNILLDRSGAWLGDFGIARRIDATMLTGEGHLIGTAGYLAPEVVAGRPAGPASDRYALAAVAFAALTGRPVFEAEGLGGLLYAHAHRTPPMPSHVAPDLPGALDAAMARALAKDPRERPASSRALVESLAHALTRSDPAVTRRMTRPLPPPRRRRVLAPTLAVLVGSAVLGGGALAVAGLVSERAPNRAGAAVAAAPAPPTVPTGDGRELAGSPARVGDLPGRARVAGAVAADVPGARVVAAGGGWEALALHRAQLGADGYTIEPLVVAQRTVGLLARPPFVLDITGQAPRWVLLVIDDGGRSRAIIAHGPFDGPERYAARLAGTMGDAISAAG